MPAGARMSEDVQQAPEIPWILPDVGVESAQAGIKCGSESYGMILKDMATKAVHCSD